jgi:hypothetical protein
VTERDLENEGESENQAKVRKKAQKINQGVKGREDAR